MLYYIKLKAISKIKNIFNKRKIASSVILRTHSDFYLVARASLNQRPIRRLYLLFAPFYFSFIFLLNLFTKLTFSVSIYPEGLAILQQKKLEHYALAIILVARAPLNQRPIRRLYLLFAPFYFNFIFSIKLFPKTNFFRFDISRRSFIYCNKKTRALRPSHNFGCEGWI